MKTDCADKPDLIDLCTHFKSKGQSHDNSTLLCEVTGNNYVHELDRKITIDDIENTKYVEGRPSKWRRVDKTHVNVRTARYFILYTSNFQCYLKVIICLQQIGE